MKFKPGRFIALAFSLGLGSACAQTYVATDLTTNSVPVNYAYGMANGVSPLYQVGFGVTGTSTQALLWQGSATNAINLNPPGYQTAYAYGINGTNSVGQGVTSTGQTNALYWQATVATSAVSLNPSIGTNAAFGSAAYGIGGGQEAGYAQNPTNAAYNAYLWRGTAASAVNLQPSGYPSSVAYATDGRQQAGYAITTLGSAHAMIWSGGPTSAQDLHPSNFFGSYATAVAPQAGSTNSVAAGYAVTSSPVGGNHAFVWPSNGATNYPVDLNPPGYISTYAEGIGSTNVVGYGNPGPSSPTKVALLWQGFSTNAVVNLSSFLPAGASNAVATCIDPSGTYIGGYAQFGNQTHAIIWQPVSAATDTPAMPPWGLAVLAGLLVAAAIFKPRPRIS